MTRRFVTMVMADLVDPTEAVTRLGDAQWLVLRVRQRQLVAAALARHDGQEMGSSGEDLLAVFEAPTRALHFAADLSAAMRSLNLRMRMGVHAGAVETDGQQVAGLNVHRTARIMALAGPDECLVSATVRDLVGRSDLGFVDRGLHPLRGVDEPQRLFSLATSTLPASRPAPDGQLPLPIAAAEQVDVPMVGREAELGRLDGWWNEAQQGRSQVVLVAGEPGIGKTRLLAELARRCHGAGAAVLWGRCDEGRATPYQPLAEALEHVATHLPRARLRRLLDGDAEQLHRLVPRLRHLAAPAPPATSSDPATEQHRLLEGVAATLGRLADEAPTLLVVDDVHWAASSTLQLVRHLASRSSSARLMLAVSYRDTAPDLDEQLRNWLGDMARLPRLNRLSLAGIDATAATELLDAIAARDEVVERAWSLPPLDRHERVRAALDRSDGNPFFLTELLRQGAARAPDTAPAADQHALPPAVQRVVGQRLSKLSTSTLETLRAAAVLGQHFHVELLARMLPHRPRQSLLESLDAAVDAHLVVEHPGEAWRYRFTHALVVDALVAATPLDHLRAAHLGAADAWEVLRPAEPAAAAEMARHHAAAGVDPVKQQLYSRAAGDDAMRALAFADAVQHYTRAVHSATRAGATDSELAWLRLALAEAEAAAGYASYRPTLESVWARALADGDGALLVAAALAGVRGDLAATGSVDQQRLAVLEAAAATSPLADDVRARLLAQLATEMQWVQSGRQRREAVADEALRLADCIEDLDARMAVIARCAAAAQHPDNVNRLGALLDRHEPALDQVRDPVTALEAAWNWLAYATIRCDGAAVQRNVDRVDTLIER